MRSTNENDFSRSEEPGKASAFSKGSTLSLAESENEIASASLFRSEEEPIELKPFTEDVKKEIYTLLKERFPEGEPVHMAAISKYLVNHGYISKVYGFSKMKHLLQAMQGYVSLQDVIISQVPNVLVTITPGALGKAAESPAGSARVRQEEESARNEEAKRASSGSVRFSGSGSSGSTFREEPEETSISYDRSKKKLNPVESFERLAYLPPKVVDFLIHHGMSDPLTTLAYAYQKSVEEQTYEQRGVTITFPVPAMEGEGEGRENMIAILKKNERPYGRPWYLTYVGFPRREEAEEEEEEQEEDHPLIPGKSLEMFADIGYWQEFLRELADMALPENWETSNRRLGRYYVLKKYIQYTFYRLQQEDKISISSDGQLAAFNTGLVNNHYDDIYACFIPNKTGEGEEGKEGKAPKWKFEAFALAGMRGKDGYGKMLTSYFDPLPPAPSYGEKTVDLIYDLSRDLVTDYDHIIIDNLRRLPLGYLRECCYGDSAAQEMLTAIQNARGENALRQAYYVLSKYIAENDKIYRRLKSRMEDAIEIALKRVRWNFRTAIPCYYPKGNSVSLMLPLCLEDDLHTDAALVVQKNPSGSYQGQTVLGLEQAYLDARLICRPNNDWLSEPWYA